MALFVPPIPMAPMRENAWSSTLICVSDCAFTSKSSASMISAPSPTCAATVGTESAVRFMPVYPPINPTSAAKPVTTGSPATTGPRECSANKLMSPSVFTSAAPVNSATTVGVDSAVILACPAVTALTPMVLPEAEVSMSAFAMIAISPVASTGALTTALTTGFALVLESSPESVTPDTEKESAFVTVRLRSDATTVKSLVEFSRPESTASFLPSAMDCALEVAPVKPDTPIDATSVAALRSDNDSMVVFPPTTTTPVAPKRASVSNEATADTLLS